MSAADRAQRELERSVARTTLLSCLYVPAGEVERCVDRLFPALPTGWRPRELPDPHYESLRWRIWEGRLQRSSHTAPTWAAPTDDSWLTYDPTFLAPRVALWHDLFTTPMEEVP